MKVVYAVSALDQAQVRMGSSIESRRACGLGFRAELVDRGGSNGQSQRGRKEDANGCCASLKLESECRCVEYKRDTKGRCAGLMVSSVKPIYTRGIYG